MKRSLSFLLILLAIILSCNTSPTPNGWLNEDNLPLQQYTIDITTDTTLITKNGALLKIPKGALTTDKGNTVTLEIKEAYSVQQIIQAGLVTQSNGEPLSSGGMIYINAKGGQNVKITQAIKVALPANYLADSMQLYKGRKDENGNINWEEPSALVESEQSKHITRGQVLFEGKCTSCHRIGKDLTGPDLAHFSKRFTGEEGLRRSRHFHYWYHPFMGDEGDLYSCKLWEMYRSVGTQFPDLSDDDLADIYGYIQNESDKNNLPLPSHAYLKDCVDSCFVYNMAMSDLQIKKEQLANQKNNLIRDNGSMVEEKREEPPAQADTASPVINFEERVSTPDYNAEYYQFTIESFGWFNIDILLKGIDGVKESELFVRITGEYREKIKVYLIIPSVKVYVEGGPAERNKEEFAFYLKNGKIALPQNAKAYIMAVTETEASIAFAIKEFTTSLKQEFDISLTSSTKEAFNAAIERLNLHNLDIKVKDTKHAQEIRKTNSEIKNIGEELKKVESLKPKNCDCQCRPPMKSTTADLLQ